MPRLILTTAALILSAPALASAVPVHIHKKVPVKREVVLHELVRGDAFVAPKTITVKKTVVDVVHVAPADDDDDGVATTDDPCPQTAGSDGGCPPPPPPEPVYAEASGASSSGYSSASPVDEPALGYPGGAIPDYITQCESGGDYGAYNPSSGATGAYQIIPSTAAAYGCDLSTQAGQDSCAAAIYATEGASAWDCG